MAIRWASDRIGEQGIIAFVTNGSWIDGNADSGVRACLAEEFSSVYVSAPAGKCKNIKENVGRRRWKRVRWRFTRTCCYYNPCQKSERDTRRLQNPIPRHRRLSHTRGEIGPHCARRSQSQVLVIGRQSHPINITIGLNSETKLLVNSIHLDGGCERQVKQIMRYLDYIH